MVDFMLRPETLVYAGIVGAVFMGLQIGAAVMVYAERKVAARRRVHYPNSTWLGRQPTPHDPDDRPF